MSDFGSAAEEMVLTIGSASYVGWLSVAVTRSAEMFPNSFAFSGGEAFPKDAAKLTADPGAKCTVTCGGDTIVTGYIDRCDITIGPTQNDVVVQGCGLCEDLVDCSADLVSDPAIRGGMINAASVLDLAQRLAKPFGVSARSAVADLGPAIPTFQIALGETPYEIIERAARYAGFLVYEDQNGVLVLDRVGATAMASGFQMPGNIEGGHAERSIDQRYSDVFVVWQSVDQLSEFGNSNIVATAHDATMPRHRPLIRQSEQASQRDAFSVAKMRANWELARRLGRSQAVTLTCDSWRDHAGNLWQPNMLATIDAPALKITKAKWIIGTVTYRKDASGTHADLVLMPPDAFDPEPKPLVLFDPELTNPVPSSQSPAPPATSQRSP